ncbi:hypothetical protein Tco_1365999, partial [Tanacetum coccineum]
SSIPPPPIVTAVVAATAVAGTSSALVLGAGIQPVIQSLFADSASPSVAGPDPTGPSNPRGTELSANTFYISQEMDSETLYLSLPGSFPIFVSEHNLKERKKFERKCARQTDLLKEKDTEIAKAARVSELNSLKERTITLEAEKSILKGQIAALESATLSYDELSIKVASLKSERDRLVDRVSSLEGTCSRLHDQVKVLSDRVVELDSELMGMAIHLDEEFYPRFLTTIAIRRWVIGHGLRLAVMKCLQST